MVQLKKVVKTNLWVLYKVVSSSINKSGLYNVLKDMVDW